ncbi:MAG: hypothetical protein Q8Q81_19705 [Oxalobacteraceae bacterium]|nr:hypothetical protein [Oxalobacteraceae bacterium]
MSLNSMWIPKVIKFWLLLIGGVSMSACAGLFDFGGESWEEEVLMHDGTTIIVTRYQKYESRHELGQEPSASEEKMTFTMPGENKKITWETNYSESAGKAELLLLGLYIVQNEAYVVALPQSCLVYANWGRPNPPYALLKYTDFNWEEISITELPKEIQVPNVVLATMEKSKIRKVKKSGLISSRSIVELNKGSKASYIEKFSHVPIDLQDLCPKRTKLRWHYEKDKQE